MTMLPTFVDRVYRRLPHHELERRWTSVRDYMARNDLQAIVALSSDDWLGGYVRWLTDRPATNLYHVVTVFRAAEPMVMIEHGNLGGHRDVVGHPDFPGVSDLYTTTGWKSIAYTYRNEADILLGLLKHWGYRRIGLVGAGAMPHGFVEALKELGLEITDATHAIDALKAVKSPDELTEIRATAAMQDEVFAALLNAVKPGMRDLDVMAIAQHEGRRRGSEQGVFLFCSGPPDQPTLLCTPHFQGRRIKPGDNLTLLIENNGPTGFYTELGRTIVFGKATPDLNDALALACTAQQQTLARLTPGTACSEVAAAHDRFLAEHSLEPETRLFAHSQGYDLVERPLIRADETMTVQSGMNIVVHPGFVRGAAFGYVCDNFIIPEAGPPESIHATEQKIFEL